MHTVALPIAYTADYGKADCSEASADALTWADEYAIHPTAIVIDPEKSVFLCLGSWKTGLFIDPLIKPHFRKYSTERVELQRLLQQFWRCGSVLSGLCGGLSSGCVGDILKKSAEPDLNE